jgi:ferritin-like protein
VCSFKIFDIYIKTTVLNGRKNKTTHKRVKKGVKAYSADQAVSYYYYVLCNNDKNRGDFNNHYAVELSDDNKDEFNDEFEEITCAKCNYADPAGPGHKCPNGCDDE